MLQFLESKLYSDVEGTCSGQFGYIIAVVSILDIGKGMILPGSGQAEFITRYRAIVFKPFKGEVVDGVVNNVNKVRFSTVPLSSYFVLRRAPPQYDMNH
jgi:DNA-directed RNA polymerase II subunit RPB7